VQPFTVELMGAPGVRAAMAAVTLTTQDAVKKAINGAAMDVVTEAKKVCPVVTGRLRSSLRATFYSNGLTAEIGTDVLYAPIVEFGLGRRPKPYLYPAFNKVVPVLEADLRRIVEGARW
jgi:hypothetical protein